MMGNSLHYSVGQVKSYSVKISMALSRFTMAISIASASGPRRARSSFASAFKRSSVRLSSSPICRAVSLFILLEGALKYLAQQAAD